MVRGFGAGLTDADTGRIGAQRGHVMARLEAQRARVRSGEPPLWPSVGFVREMIQRLGDRYGIPEEYRPKLLTTSNGPRSPLVSLSRLSERAERGRGRVCQAGIGWGSSTRPPVWKRR